MPGQVAAVLARRRHLGRERGIARPQAHVVPGVRQMHGQRRAPAARSDHADAVRHVPSARSVRDQQPRHVAAVPEQDQRRRRSSRRCRRRADPASSIRRSAARSSRRSIRARRIAFAPTTSANAAAATSVGTASARRTRRSPWRRLCRRGTAARPDRCGRRRPRPRRPPHSIRRRRATPRRRPCPCRRASPRSRVDNPAVRYTLVAPTLPLPTRRRSIPPRALRDEITDRQRADGVADEDGGNHFAALINGALTNQYSAAPAATIGCGRA